MAKVIGGTTTTPMRMPESGGGAIYLQASEANYSLLKDYLDKGQSVIIVKDGMHYYCVSRSDSNITFQSTFLEKVNILDYSEGSEEPYDGGTTLLDYADVKSNYDPSSFEPISGKGVAAALANYSTGEKEWTLLNDITLTEAANIIDDGSYDKVYEELWIEGVVKFETDATSAKTGMFFLAMRGSMSAHCEYWGSISNGSTWYLRAHGYKSPSGKLVWDTLRHTNYYVAATPYQTAGTSTENVDGFNQCRISIGADGNNAGFRFGAGPKFKVWGR